MIVPGSTAAAAMALAERLCDAVGRGAGRWTTRPLRVTVSVGVAPVAAGADVRGQRWPTPTSRSTRRRARAATGRGCSPPTQYDQAAARRVSLLQRVGAALDEGTMQL